MAYTEKIYATDSWKVIGNYSTETPIRGPIIESVAVFDFYSGGVWTPNEYTYFALDFPRPQNYGKKRIVSSILYIYVISKKCFGSGELAGEFIFQLSDRSGDWFWTSMGYDYGSQFSINEISNGAYLSIPWYKKKRMNVVVGATSPPYANRNYQANASLSIYSHTGSNKPYAVLTFEDVVPFVNSPFPSSGFINEKVSNTFSWKFSYSNPYINSIYGEKEDSVQELIKQASAKFRWRPLGQTSYTEMTISGDQQFITIPAGTFTTDQVQWQVVVTSDDGVEGTPSDWFTLTTVDTLSTPVAVSPQNVMVDGAEPCRFIWDHVISTGSPQTKFILEYSDDNGLTWDPLGNGQTDKTETIIPKDTLPAGQLLWRVKTYNSDDAAGEWSSAVNVTVRSAPPTPSITGITQAARPEIRWAAVGQQSYELVILSDEQERYRVPETASTVGIHKVTDYLNPGGYTVLLRIKNAYGLASVWVSAAFTASFVAPSPPGVNVMPVPDGIRLDFNGGAFKKLYILRDGIPMIRLASTVSSWIDYATLGDHSYVIRGIDANDSFSDSDPAAASVSVGCSTLAAADDLKNMIRLVFRRDAPPSWSQNLDPGGQGMFYAGRSNPVYEFGEFSNTPFTWAGSLLNKSDADRLEELVKRHKTVRYRDRYGEAFWCALTGLQINRERKVWDVTLSGVKVDYVERIEYDGEGS